MHNTSASTHLTNFHLTMVFATICEVASANIHSYATKNRVSSVRIINCSYSPGADFELHNTYDIRTHLLQFQVTGTHDDLNELTARIEGFHFDTPCMFEVHGFENNTTYVF